MSVPFVSSDARRVHCAVATECGGCPTIAESESIVRLRKQRLVEQRLRELVGSPVTTRFHPTVSVPNYRNRIRMRIDPAGRVVFFNRNKSSACAVLEPGLLQRLAGLEDAFRGLGEQLACYGHVELRAPDLEGRAALFLGGNLAQVSPTVRTELRARLESLGLLVAFADEAERPEQRFEVVPGVVLGFPVGSFQQVNPGINRALVEHVVQGAGLRRPQVVVDLFCGAGNFTLPVARALAPSGAAVWGVEADAAALAAAQRSSAAGGWRVQWCHQDVEDWLRRCAEPALSQPGPRLVLSDAPRAGLKSAGRLLAQWKPEHVVLCSCHVAGWERDVALFVERGYLVDSVELFDMFAFTDHVEIVTWLRRRVRPGAERVLDTCTDFEDIPLLS